MADSTPTVPAGSPAALIQGFIKLPASRQAVLLVALAACIASVIGIVLWARTPDLQPAVRQPRGARRRRRWSRRSRKPPFPYRLDAATGALRVPSTAVHEARMKLAAEGLPKGSGSGLEMLGQEPGFGVSSFMENARYQHAVEGELVRTIGAMAGVQQARVHLAIPERSVFVRDRDKPTASVMLQLYRGRTLDDGQVAAIVHLVSSSVPDLAAARVTVVDQAGNLLTRPAGQGGLNRSGEQYDYARRLEQDYVRRIEDLLAAVVGPGGVRAKVSAEVDFEVTERTREEYQPERAVLRSSQEESSPKAPTGGAASGGVPGTLSNQPPQGGSLAPQRQLRHRQPRRDHRRRHAGARRSAGRSAGGRRGDRRQGPQPPLGAQFRDRPHRQPQQAGRRRRQAPDGGGGGGRPPRPPARMARRRAQPRSPEELDRYTALVKDAVGFDAERGDSINVVNAAFAPTEPAPAAAGDAGVGAVLAVAGGAPAAGRRRAGGGVAGRAAADAAQRAPGRRGGDRPGRTDPQPRPCAPTGRAVAPRRRVWRRPAGRPPLPDLHAAGPAAGDAGDAQLDGRRCLSRETERHRALGDPDPGAGRAQGGRRAAPDGAARRCSASAPP